MRKLSSIICLLVVALLASCMKEPLPVLPSEESEKGSPVFFSSGDTKAEATAATLQKDGFNVSMFHTECPRTASLSACLFENDHFILSSGSDYHSESYSSTYYWPTSTQLQSYAAIGSYGMSVWAVWPNDYSIDDYGGTQCREPFIRVSHQNIGNSQNLNMLVDPYFTTVNDASTSWLKWYLCDYSSAKGILSVWSDYTTISSDVLMCFIQQYVELTANHVYYVTATLDVEADNLPLSACFLEIDDVSTSSYSREYYYAEYFSGSTYEEGTVTFLYRPCTTITHKITVSPNVRMMSGETDFYSEIRDVAIYDLGEMAMPSDQTTYIEKLSLNVGLKDIIVASAIGKDTGSLDSQGRLPLTFVHPLCCIDNLSAVLSSADPSGISTVVTEMTLTAPSLGSLFFPNTVGKGCGTHWDYYWLNDGNTTTVDLLPLVQTGGGTMTVTTTESYSDLFQDVSLVPYEHSLSSSSSYPLRVAWTYYQNGTSLGSYYNDTSVPLTPGVKSFVKLTIPSYGDKDKSIGIDTRQSTPTTEDL